MAVISTKNHFQLLALLLSPCKDSATIERLALAIVDRAFDWRPVVYLSSLHLCSPLLYQRLQSDRLLPLLPEELQEFLTQLFQLNLERNNEFFQALAEVVRRLQAIHIEPVLLKGGACIVDNLYGSFGARVIQDLDLLLRPADLAAATTILAELGFEPMAAPEQMPDGLPTDARHHHLPMFVKPDSPVGLELHFKVAYGQAGRILDAAAVWQGRCRISCRGLDFFVPDPGQRLLHNAVHALLPQTESIRSWISLLQLAEFAHLAQRYAAKIDWPAWYAAGCQQGFGNELLAYAVLAQQLMGMEWPAGLPKKAAARFHARRFLAGGNLLSHPKINTGGLERLRQGGIGLLLRGYYYARLPGWVWRNVCYAEGPGNLPVRVRYFWRKAMSPRSRGKI